MGGGNTLTAIGIHAGQVIYVVHLRHFQFFYNSVYATVSISDFELAIRHFIQYGTHTLHAQYTRHTVLNFIQWLLRQWYL